MTVLSDEGLLNVINGRRLHHDAIHQKRLPHPLPDGFGILRAELVVPGTLSGWRALRRKIAKHGADAPEEGGCPMVIQFLFPEALIQLSRCLADIDNPIFSDLAILCRQADSFTQFDAIQTRHIRNHVSRESAYGNEVSLQQVFSAAANPFTAFGAVVSCFVTFGVTKGRVVADGAMADTGFRQQP